MVYGLCSRLCRLVTSYKQVTRFNNQFMTKDYYANTQVKLVFLGPQKSPPIYLYLAPKLTVLFVVTKHLVKSLFLTVNLHHNCKEPFTKVGTSFPSSLVSLKMNIT